MFDLSPTAPPRGESGARWRTPPLAALALLAGIPLAACERSAADDFDADRAWAHLARIVALGPRPAGSEALDELRDDLERELAALGLEPVRESFVVETTPVGRVEFANVYADIEGRGRDGSTPGIVVLCTHIDTKRASFEFVGANDGGSGTAVLLELARCLAAAGPHAVTYRILFLDGEEAFRWQWRDPDNRYGSRHHVEELRRSGLLPRIKAAILLDMCGDAELRFHRELYSDQQLLRFFFEAARGDGLGAHVDGTAQEINDDHLSFMAANVPSVDLIDFSFGPGNAYWHAAEDTLDKCSARSLGITGRIVLLGLPKVESWASRR